MNTRSALERRTPLAPGKGLTRKTPMPRGNGPARTGVISSHRSRSKPRPPGDAAAEDLARGLVYERSGGVCELQIPGHCRGRATNWAHRLPEGQGGPWLASNGLHLCGMGNASGCHGYSENNRTESYENGWLLKRGQDPLLVPVRLPDLPDLPEPLSPMRPAGLVLDNEGGSRPLNRDELRLLQDDSPKDDAV